MDDNGWSDLVDGVTKLIIQQGFLSVPEGPGLDVTPNKETIKQRLGKPPNCFDTTPQWDEERSGDCLWS